MNPTYLTYHLKTGKEMRILSILLDDPASRPTSTILKLFHEAVSAWTRKNRGTFIRSQVGGESGPAAAQKMLMDYTYGDNTFNSARFQRHLSSLATSGTIHQFIPRPGAPVEGPDLWGREKEESKLIKQLQKGSCHLRAPRRYGKTSLLRRAEEKLMSSGSPVVFVDLSGCESADDFFAVLAEVAMDRTITRRALEGRIRELAGWPEPGSDSGERSSARKDLVTKIGADAIRFGDRLLSALAYVSAVLLLDEFSLFLRTSWKKDENETRNILNVLKNSRQKSPATRQILAGSSGLSAYVHFFTMGNLLNDLRPLDLKPLEDATARQLAEELLYGSGLRPTPAAVAAILNEIGIPVPYFIHALCDAVREEAANTRILSVEIVHSAYRQRILGPVGSHLFRIYRLDNQPYPESLRRPAARLLHALSETPAGVTEKSLRNIYRVEMKDDDHFDALMACLSEDYDLEHLPPKWRMRNKVIRERWLLFGQLFH